jgi:16S rRNA (guanine966-N2)-methyltransferase
MSALRIVAGAWRGRTLVAPAGLTTRPTAGRVRQALFDMLAHASWADQAIVGRTVLDVFAGSGALGLEALSRGAASATFIDNHRAAADAVRRNIVACNASNHATLLDCNALTPPPGQPQDLIFLDPPYGRDLIPHAVMALAKAGWIAPGALIVAEFGIGDPLPADVALLAERSHAVARISIWRHM